SRCRAQRNQLSRRGVIATPAIGLLAATEVYLALRQRLEAGRLPDGRRRAAGGGPVHPSPIWRLFAAIRQSAAVSVHPGEQLVARLCERRVSTRQDRSHYS